MTMAMTYGITQCESEELEQKMAVERAFCSAVVIDEDKIAVVGGSNSKGFSVSTVEMFDTTRKEWRMIPSMNINRGRCCAASVGSRIFVFGGYSGKEGELDSAEMFDLHTWKWNLLPPMPEPRFGASAVKIDDDRIALVGGSEGGRTARDVSIYTISQQQWSRLPSLSVGRTFCTAVAFENKLYAIGGRGQATVEVLDLSSARWRVMPSSMEAAREGCGAVVCWNGKIIVAGGKDEYMSHQSCEMLNLFSAATPRRLEDEGWVYLLSMTHPRYGCSVVSLSDGSVYIVGGKDGTRYWSTIERINSAGRDSQTIFLDDTIKPPAIPLLPQHTGRNFLQKLALEQWVGQVTTAKKDYESHVEAESGRLYTSLSNKQSQTETAVSQRESQISDLVEQIVKLKQDYQEEEGVVNSHLDELKSTAATWLQTVEGQIEDARSQINALEKEMASKKKVHEAVDSAETSFSRPPPMNPFYTGRSLKPSAPPSSSSEEAPSHLLCPITLEIMNDPVIAADGLTYERKAIDHVFASCHSDSALRSPVTNAPLPSRILIPNVAIRGLVREFEEKMG